MNSYRVTGIVQAENFSAAVEEVAGLMEVEEVKYIGPHHPDGYYETLGLPAASTPNLEEK